MNCIVIHGCPSSEEGVISPETRTYDKHWLFWIKDQLNAVGIRTEAPLMPEPWAPDYEKFKKAFDKFDVNEETILIGHSCGASFLVRWLGDSKKRALKLILVAPWKIADEGDALREAYYTFEVDATIKDRVREIAIFTSDDEAHEGKESAGIFHRALGGTVIELKGHGHYTLEDMRTTEFPELLEVVTR